MSGLNAKRIECELRRLAGKDVRILRIREFQGGERFELQHDALVPRIASWRDHVLAKRASRRRMLLSGLPIVVVVLLSGTAQYFSWRNDQPWGLLANLFDGHLDMLKENAITIGRSTGLSAERDQCA